MFFSIPFSCFAVFFAFGKSTQSTVMTSDGFHSLNLTLWTWNHRENIENYAAFTTVWKWSIYIHLYYIIFFNTFHKRSIFSDRWRARWYVLNIKWPDLNVATAVTNLPNLNGVGIVIIALLILAIGDFAFELGSIQSIYENGQTRLLKTFLFTHNIHSNFDMSWLKNYTKQRERVSWRCSFFSSSAQ